MYAKQKLFLVRMKQNTVRPHQHWEMRQESKRERRQKVAQIGFLMKLIFLYAAAFFVAIFPHFFCVYLLFIYYTFLYRQEERKYLTIGNIGGTFLKSPSLSL